MVGLLFMMGEIICHDRKKNLPTKKAGEVIHGYILKQRRWNSADGVTLREELHSRREDKAGGAEFSPPFLTPSRRPPDPCS